jgi:hypothetical protein
VRCGERVGSPIQTAGGTVTEDKHFPVFHMLPTVGEMRSATAGKKKELISRRPIALSVEGSIEVDNTPLSVEVDNTRPLEVEIIR